MRVLGRLYDQTEEDATNLYRVAITRRDRWMRDTVTGEPLDGSIIGVLMIVSIVVTLVRIYLDHCTDKDSFINGAVDACTDGSRYQHVLRRVGVVRDKVMRKPRFRGIDLDGVTPLDITEALFGVLRDTNMEELEGLWYGVDAANKEDKHYDNDELQL